MVQIWFIFPARRIKVPYSQELSRFEGPIADIDNDGQADVLVVSNDYFKDILQIFCDGGVTTRGLRIYGSPNKGFVRTRRVWNQHTYHITNSIVVV